MSENLQNQLKMQQQAARSLRLQREKREREIKEALVNIENKRGKMYG
jgi:hypothetical protein